MIDVVQTYPKMKEIRRRMLAMDIYGSSYNPISVQELRQRIPALTGGRPESRLPVIGGTVHPDAAIYRHDAVAWGYARGAENLGIKLHQHTGVVKILRRADGRIEGVETNRGRIRVGKVAVVLSGHTTTLTDTVGLKLPLKSCLIAIIDDATSEVHAEFFESETTVGCLKVLRGIIARRGKFKTLYVDKAGIFGGPKRCNFSQIQRACSELGIQIIFANSPRDKGRIERSFDTFQDRLVPELRLNDIEDMDGANQYLQSVFIPTFWRGHIEVFPRNVDTEFTAIPEHINLDDIFVVKDYR